MISVQQKNCWAEIHEQKIFKNAKKQNSQAEKNFLFTIFPDNSAIVVFVSVLPGLTLETS